MLWVFRLNALRPSDACIREETRASLVQIMACRLFGAMSLSEPMLKYCYWILRNKLQWNFNRNSYIFSHENAFENVWKRATILSRPQYVSTLIYSFVLKSWGSNCRGAGKCASLQNQNPYLVSWNKSWCHQMEAFYALLARSSLDSPYKGQARRALIISLICTWINGWANNREAGTLSHHRAHYDVTAMSLIVVGIPVHLQDFVGTFSDTENMEWALHCIKTENSLFQWAFHDLLCNFVFMC